MDIQNINKFIAWEKHRRTLSLCHYLDIEPFLMESSLPRIVKFPYFFVKTMQFLLKNRPSNLIIQNPSIVLAIIACFFKKMLKYRLIIDAHNAAILPDGKYLSKFNLIYRFVQNKADATIVTNDVLAKIVMLNKGRPIILPDKLPTPPNVKKLQLKGKFNVVYICTFAEDDPYQEVIDACKLLPHDFQMYITGNYSKLKREIINGLPENIFLTGYLDDIDYWNLIASVDLVIDLTTRENCLVCGAYEAVSVGSPIMLSDTHALRQYFHKGTVFVDNESRCIADGILFACDNVQELLCEIRSLKAEIMTTWETRGTLLKNMLKNRNGILYLDYTELQ